MSCNEKNILNCNGKWENNNGIRMDKLNINMSECNKVRCNSIDIIGESSDTLYALCRGTFNYIGYNVYILKRVMDIQYIIILF